MLLFSGRLLGAVVRSERGWDAEDRVLPGALKAQLLARAARGKGALLDVRAGESTHLEVQ